jgi:LysR family transcriptional regulator, nod-box dependent transcriptional activator
MNLAGVDLNLLVALDALLAERSVTRAAERLGLSQSGMSNTLARLRKLTGDPLLVREGLTMVATPRAESLRQPVQEALSLIQFALDNRSGFEPASDRATFTVSCSDYSTLMLIGPLVRRLAAAAPGLTIQVLPRAPDPVALLRDGEADLVIEPAEIMPDAALPSIRLFADRWLCCVWEGNAQVGDRMTMETYLRLGHVVYSAVPGHPVALPDTYLARAQVPRRTEFTVESFLLAPFLLQGTDLVTLVPERASGHLRRTAAVRFLEPPLPLPPITETLWWHPRHTLDPAHAWLRARIAETAAELKQGGAPPGRPALGRLEVLGGEAGDVAVGGHHRGDLGVADDVGDPVEGPVAGALVDLPQEGVRRVTAVGEHHQAGRLAPLGVVGAQGGLG